LLEDSGGTPTLQFHDANESISSDGSKLILKSNNVTFNMPTADGSDGHFLKTNGSGTLSFAAASASSLACDDLTEGDAAVLISTSSGNITIDATANDSDIIFKGTDGGSDTTFLTLDGSAAGAATFNDKIIATELDISGDIDVDGTTNLDVVDIDGAVDMASTLGVSGVVTANAGVVVDNITIDGTEIDLSSGDLTLDVAGDIVLDAGGGEVIFKDGSTNTGHVSLDSNNLTIKSLVSDKDMIFQGNDGGSGITALTLDMSAAGAATFNNDVTAFSDIRLKENIETIPDALNKVCQMRGVTFDRIDADGERQMGVIAQEVEKIAPEVVREDKSEDKIKSVAYGNMVGLLIESIKELKAEIEELKKEK
jgi:cytoskeletal protein CcmA (bactofilin family)